MYNNDLLILSLRPKTLTRISGGVSESGGPLVAGDFLRASRRRVFHFLLGKSERRQPSDLDEGTVSLVSWFSFFLFSPHPVRNTRNTGRKTEKRRENGTKILRWTVRSAGLDRARVARINAVKSVAPVDAEDAGSCSTNRVAHGATALSWHFACQRYRRRRPANVVVAACRR